MDKKRFADVTDLVILIFLTIQIVSVSISIAISSVSFGIWVSVWIIQIAFTKAIGPGKMMRRELKYVNIFTAFYIFFEIISRFFAVYPDGAFVNLKRLLLFLIFYVSIIKIIKTEILVKLLLINAIVLSIISITEIINYSIKFEEMISEIPFSEIRIDYFNYPITSAEIKMMSLLSLIPAAFLKDSFIIRRKYLILIMLPIFISMMLTQSRNVFLAFFLCLLVYGIVINRKFLIVYIILLIAGALILPDKYTYRIKSITDMTHLSNKSRLEMWTVGWKMFKDHPLTGVADSHIREIYETYKKPEESSEGVHLHSNFMMILATTGIFGFAGFILMFTAIFIKQIEYYRKSVMLKEKMLIFGSILVFISFQISGIFEWNFGDHEVMTVYFFLISVPFVLKNILLNEA